MPQKGGLRSNKMPAADESAGGQRIRGMPQGARAKYISGTQADGCEQARDWSCDGQHRQPESARTT